MENREKLWMKRREGLITASELGQITSASGKIIDGNIDYIRKKRFARLHGFTYPISGWALEAGKEAEKYAVEWFRKNYADKPIIYASECKEIPFWKASWGNFGASPDCFSEDESFVLEIKSLVGNTTAEFFSDRFTSDEEKRDAVLKEHGQQIAGQFLSNDKVKEIWVLKYVPQRDDVDEDCDSPLDWWRGNVFKFRREDFDLEALKDRILLFDKFIDSSINAKDLKLGYILDSDGNLVLSK